MQFPPFPSRRPSGAVRLLRRAGAARALRVALLVTGILLASSSLVTARRLAAPQPWPQHVLVVRDRSNWNSAVQAAIAQWNAADVGLRLRLARRGEPAQVRILTDGRRVRRWCSHARQGCVAFSSRIGAGRGPVDIVLPDAASRFARGHPEPAEVRLVAHELGHAMGLEHAHGPCAVMNPDIDLPGCRHVPGSALPTDEVCGPLPADVRAAAALYGGRGRPQIACGP